jgi:PAP2 superfamily
VIDVDKALSAEQLKVARYWVDGHGSVTPPGRWNRIAIDAVLKRKLDEKDTLRLFSQMNIALADTFIAVWETKYYYWTARPITVAKTVFGDELKTPILTPPFPSYVSGHAAFSGAASTILSRFIAEDAEQFTRQAEEAAHSRLLGGIHFRHDNEDGLLLGRRIGLHVFETLNRDR